MAARLGAFGAGSRAEEREGAGLSIENLCERRSETDVLIHVAQICRRSNVSVLSAPPCIEMRAMGSTVAKKEHTFYSARGSRRTNLARVNQVRELTLQSLSAGMRLYIKE